MFHPSSLDVVTGWKLDEVHPAVMNPGTFAVHEDVVLPLSAVKIIRLNARPSTTATFSSTTRTSSLQCKTTSSDPKHYLSAVAGQKKSHRGKRAPRVVHELAGVGHIHGRRAA